MSGNNQPVLFENHGIDARYTGPLDVAPTISARFGTGFSEPHVHDTDSHD
jgi:DNA (cytosine-5)-methyltransferase 1